MENGSVWDIMSNDQFKTIEKNLLIQLPKSRNYHTFSTNNQVLNFVKDDISSNIIQYSLNNQNYIKIKQSSLQFKDIISDGFLDFPESTDNNLFAGLSFRHGIQVGSLFWLVFGEYDVENPINPLIISKSSTMLWFSNKQRWRRGPDLQLSPESFSNFCSSSLNSTAILFVFLHAYQYQYGDHFVTKVAIFNFQYKVWTDIPKMKEKLQDYYLECTMATFFNKQTRPKVVVVFNEFQKNIKTLYSVDLNLNNDATWKQESIWFQSEDIGM